MGENRYVYLIKVSISCEISLSTYELFSYTRKYELFEVFDRYRIHPRKLWRVFLFLRSYRPEVVHFQGAQHPTTYLLTWFVLMLVTGAKFVYTPQHPANPSSLPKG